MRQFFISFAIMIVTVTAGVLGYIYWQDQQSYITTNNAKLEAELYPVRTMKTGILTDWQLNVGDKINQGSVLGKVAGQNLTSDTTATVIKTAVYPKQTVLQGQTLAQLANLDEVYILAYIDESKIDQVKRGKEVKVKIESLSDSEFIGKVEEIGFHAGNANATISNSDKKVVQRVPVKITVDHLPTEQLTLGVHAEVKIEK